MALALESESFESGAVIIREGEKGDNFYIIEDGTVEVQKEGKKVADLSVGQFFGEKALLSEDVRQATCIASGEVKVRVDEEHSDESMMKMLRIKRSKRNVC